MVTAQALLLALAITSSDETVLLDFSAQWCEPCRTMEPVVSRLSANGFPIRKIDVDQDPATASRFRVTGLPCFVMLVNGREVDRVVGAASHGRLLQMFEHAKVVPANSNVRGQSPDVGESGWASNHELAAPAQMESDVPRAQPMATNPAAGAIDRAMAATVRIKVEDAQGHGYATGTVIDIHGSEGLAVTCGHVFRESGGKGPITVETFATGSPQSAKGFLVSYDLTRDIALISFNLPQLIAPASVAASGNAIRPGINVFSIGCDRGAAPSVRQSRITSIDKYQGPPNIEVAGQPVVGRSGGGLFTANGELIGICNYADPADNEGIFASLPTIHWELDRIGQRRIYQRDNEALVQAIPLDRPASAKDSEVPRQLPLVAAAARNDFPKNLPHDMELICIVRSRSNPRRANEVIVLNQPSRALIEQLRSGSNGLVPVEIADRPRRAPVVRAQSADR